MILTSIFIGMRGNHPVIFISRDGRDMRLLGALKGG